MRKPVIIALPKGGRVTLRQMQKADKVIIGGAVVKNRNGLLDPKGLVGRDYIKSGEELT